MATNIFHLFSQLPKELRDLIWFFAIEPAKPSARFIFDPWDTRYAKIVWPKPAQEAERTPAPTRRCLGIHRRPYAWDNLAKHPSTVWTMSNQTAYLVNKELWVTCRESHEAMRRCFDCLRQSSPSIIEPNHRSHLTHHSNTVSVSGFYLNAARQPHLTFPADDLICFDFPNWEPDWESFREMAGMLCVTGRPLNLAFYFGVSGVGSYYPADDPHATFLVDLTTHMSHCIRAVWLVDEGLERRCDETSTTNDGIEFYGENCRLIEVQPNDPAWEGYQQADHTFYDVWDVVYEAERLTTEMGFGGKLKSRPKFGVLALECKPEQQV